ncbi:MAG: hypothetical protein RIG82_09985 [Phycisphaeraceae bacterium]
MSALLVEAGRTLGQLWARGPKGARWYYVGGALLIASGLLHVPVLLIDGSDWAGPVSWRKPILFGISTGVTLISLGWVYGLLHGSSQTWLDRVSRIVALAAVLEVGLITLQAWRGVPSHFNIETGLDRSIHYAIDAMVILIMLMVLWLSLASFRIKTPAIDSLSADDRLGIRFGMLALSFSCLFGLYMLIYGMPRAEAGKDPGLYGEAGVLKFVHGIAIHALQLLPVTTWLMKWLGVSQTVRIRSSISLALGITLLTAYAWLQTFSGLPRFDPTLLAAGVLIAGLLFLALPAGLVTALLVKSRCRPTRMRT